MNGGGSVIEEGARWQGVGFLAGLIQWTFWVIQWEFTIPGSRPDPWRTGLAAGCESRLLGPVHMFSMWNNLFQCEYDLFQCEYYTETGYFGLSAGGSVIDGGGRW